MGVEAAIFVWLAVAMPFPWPLSIGLASFVASTTLATYLNPPDEERKGWPRRAKLALWLALGLDVLLTAFLGLILFLILDRPGDRGQGARRDSRWPCLTDRRLLCKLWVRAVPDIHTASGACHGGVARY